ncbi:MAG: PilN domain-containing protein [Candidatus Marinimicrobia bacterium]|jgi:Tfp pilus assembly protein PilN|nr:PilN domain-containing protein [Candidatus Neomarinimicrobiota bacterium]MBT4361269.1 PilN domain-containing protein [Candidatus Neomarinimicrobiota bacterium]MBT4714046.1 PilN domain-containing protein [Candidatus Neomarinimicrobiota bacterium]MBT4948028.1 PilN domain-containing protein [Candidatus Neomarinimicrobiota bacterium]MBT5269306.1 PilN domain-containing protein [Candidatus Neomarinimicrobiota bacterium]
MINVIKINLNQASSKAARLEKRRETTRWGAFGFVVLILIAGFAYLVGENSQYAQIIEEKESQIATIQAQIDTLKQEGRNLAKDDILAMSELSDRRTIWAEKLNALGRLMPHDMAITHLTFKDRYLTIAGVSRIYPDEREFDILEEFIARLENDIIFSEDFTDIKFASYSRMTILNQDVVNFEVRATLDIPDPKDRKKDMGRRS